MQTGVQEEKPPAKNAPRHFYISYRVAETQDVPNVALQSGTSPKKIFSIYREVFNSDKKQLLV
jgi:hypothetical protein